MNSITRAWIRSVQQCTTPEGVVINVPGYEACYSVAFEMPEDRAFAMWAAVSSKIHTLNSLPFLHHMPQRVMFAALSIKPTKRLAVSRVELLFKLKRLGGWQPVLLQPNRCRKFRRFKVYNETDLRYLQPRNFRGCRIGKRAA